MPHLRAQGMQVESGHSLERNDRSAERAECDGGRVRDERECRCFEGREAQGNQNAAGNRNRSAEPLKSFHDGAFKVAKETGCAIIPCVIFNTKKVLPPEKSFYFRPHKLRMHFLPAVIPGPDESYTDLKEKVFLIMKDYYLAHAD